MKSIIDEGDAIFIISDISNDILLKIPYYLEDNPFYRSTNCSCNKEEAISLAEAIIEEFY